MTFDLVMNILLAAVAVAILVSMWRFHSNARYRQFNLLDLITNNDGHAHRPAVMEFGAFLIMTWGFVILINRGTLTEWYAGIYVGTFVVRGGWSAYLKSKEGENAAQGQPQKTS